MGIIQSILKRFWPSFGHKPSGVYACRLFWGVVVATLMISAPVLAQDVEPGRHFGLGPFQVHTQSPAHGFRLTLPPMVPGKIIPGRFLGRLGGTWANIWADDDRYFLDYETFDVNASLGYGVSPRLFISLGFDRRAYFGGALDGFIQEFHDILNIEQQGRDEVPRNQTRIVFYDENHNVIAASDDLDLLQTAGIVASAQYIIHHGTESLPAIGISGTLRYGIETPDEEDDDEPIDIGVSIGLSKGWTDRWYTYFSGSFTYFGQSEYVGIQLNDTLLSATLGLEWRWRPNLSLLAQYLITEGAVEDLGQLSDPSQEVTIGVKWQPENWGVISLGIIENIFNHDNSPDLGLHLMYAYQF